MISEIKLFNNDVLNVNIKTVTDDDNNIWFKGKDIATFLEYADTKKAISMHVDADYKQTFGSLMTHVRGGESPPHHLMQNHTIYINEAGLYQLVFQSKKPEAKQFTKWIIEDVIPSIRKTGKYSIPLVENHISLINERDLHFKASHFYSLYIISVYIIFE